MYAPLLPSDPVPLPDRHPLPVCLPVAICWTRENLTTLLFSDHEQTVASTLVHWWRIPECLTFSRPWLVSPFLAPPPTFPLAFLRSFFSTQGFGILSPVTASITHTFISQRPAPQQLYFDLFFTADSRPGNDAFNQPGTSFEPHRTTQITPTDGSDCTHAH